VVVIGAPSTSGCPSGRFGDAKVVHVVDSESARAHTVSPQLRLRRSRSILTALASGRAPAPITSLDRALRDAESAVRPLMRAPTPTARHKTTRV